MAIMTSRGVLLVVLTLALTTTYAQEIALKDGSATARPNLEKEAHAERPLDSAMAANERGGMVTRDFSSCPRDYPGFGRLGDLLKAWSPNQPEAPEGFEEALKVCAAQRSKRTGADLTP